MGKQRQEMQLQLDVVTQVGVGDETPWGRHKQFNKRDVRVTVLF